MPQKNQPLWLVFSSNISVHAINGAHKMQHLLQEEQEIETETLQACLAKRKSIG